MTSGQKKGWAGVWALGLASLVGMACGPAQLEGELAPPRVAEESEGALVNGGAIENPSFTTFRTALPVNTWPANFDLTQGSQLLGDITTLFPAGPLSGSTHVTSSAFTVPAAAQSLHLEFLTGNASNGAHRVPLYLEVLSGPSYSTVTRIDEDTLWSSLDEGWRGGKVSLQAFAGQSIKLRFTTWNHGEARAKFRAVTLHTEVPRWQLSNGRTGQLLSFEGPTGSPYLRLSEGNQSATTELFTLPAGAQTLRFKFKVGNVGDGLHRVPLYVEVLHGTIATRIDEDTAWGSMVEGWKSAVLNLQPFVGQNIRLRFTTWNHGNAQASLGGLGLYTELPGWTSSNAGWTLITEQQRLPSTDKVTPDNADFSTGLTPLDTAPLNPAFDEPMQPSGIVISPASYTLTGGMSLTSAPFTVKATVQSLRLRFMTGNASDPAHRVPLYVEVLTQGEFAAATRIDDDTLWRSLGEGWTEAVLGLQAFRGKTVQLRFTSWNHAEARAAVDSLTLQTEVPGWEVSNGRTARLVNDGLATAHLWLTEGNQTATSSDFLVPLGAQSLRFRYTMGNNSDPQHVVPLNVEVLSGEGYSLVTRIDDDTLWSSAAAGWKTAILNLQPFKNQRIKLRFRTWNHGEARARIDALRLYTETPSWESSHAGRARIEAPAGNPLLWLEQGNTSATSTQFKVPATTQFVTFDYLVGNVTDPAHRVPLYVQILSGLNFVTVTRIDGDLYGATNDGWRTARLDLRYFKERIVKLRFLTWNHGAARARIDNIAFQTGPDTPVRGPDYPLAGNFLHLIGGDRIVTTSAFTVSSPSSTLRFKHQHGNIEDGAHRVPLYVEVLSGPQFGTRTRIDHDLLWRTLNEGWQDSELSLSAFQGQLIKVAFRSWNHGNARVRLDELNVAGDGDQLPFTPWELPGPSGSCLGFELGQAYGRTCTAYAYGRGCSADPEDQEIYAATNYMHSGLDFSLPMKTPLYAVASGTLVCAGQGNCNWPSDTPQAGWTLANGTTCWDGNCCPAPGSPDAVQYFSAGCEGSGVSPTKHRLVLRTPDNRFIVYGHIWATASGLTVGSTVSAGQLLGYSGSANGPHLHYEVRDINNRAYDPTNFFASNVQTAMLRDTSAEHFCQGDYGDQPVTVFGTYDGWMKNGCTPSPRSTGSKVLRCQFCSFSADAVVCMGAPTE
ncbi:M23 family metallopeptidase [Hyalangium sp.]|uniref:M23 family metallopeptidase n=1 Tax=Hyalangium sp. TaxID=2028555 RepID=UPI002D50E1E8|nr:M23 family metallopeptidase [Hyalangium sp.]HYH94349.1 M23 family metallopeptidase [Hyalangium sp.]